MLSFQRANELEVKGMLPGRLKIPLFKIQQPLWQKGSTIPLLQSKSINAHKYEYIKIGKTFGFEIVRYLTFFQGHLFYYDAEDDEEFKGYCDMENVYVQWLPLNSERYLLYLTNGTEATQFFFKTDTFWKHMETQISKVAIKLNFKDRYQVIEQIGKGSFSKVYHVTHIDSKKEYAAKIINKKDKNKACTKSLVLQQRKILRLINSPYVYEFEQLYEQDEFYIMIIEYLPGKDLMVLWKQQKVKELHVVVFLLKQILEGIKDIHKAGVIHRDLKPQNILVNLTNLKPFIIDFGLSLCLDNTITNKSFKRCGTMGYMAPQVIENSGEHKKPYGPQCDIFSFGIISHMLLLGFNPLKGANYDETFLKNKACDIELNKKAINEKCGEHGFIFLTKLLSKYPQFRYDADHALHSPFFSDKKQELKQKDKQESSTQIHK